MFVFTERTSKVGKLTLTAQFWVTVPLTAWGRGKITMVLMSGSEAVIVKFVDMELDAFVNTTIACDPANDGKATLKRFVSDCSVNFRLLLAGGPFVEKVSVGVTNWN